MNGKFQLYFLFLPNLSTKNKMLKLSFGDYVIPFWFKISSTGLRGRERGIWGCPWKRKAIFE